MALEASATDRVTGFRRVGTSVELELQGGGRARIDVLSAHVIRFRLSRSGDFAQSPTIRHGFARESLSPAEGACIESDLRADMDELKVTIHTPAVRVELNRNPLGLALFAPDGELLLEGATPWSARWGSSCFGAADSPACCFRMGPEEHYWGFGFHRAGLDCRGKSLEWTRQFRHRSATVPFFMSSRGYGFLSNNSFRHVFDFTTVESLDGGYYTVTADGGGLDFFLIHGPTLRAILGRYVELTGRPMLPPRYALGLLYICRYFETQEGVLELARGFRQHDIPCDMIGLEPGWEDVPYAMDWRWSPERFPDPKAMIQELRREGFVLELWESGDAPIQGYADPETRRKWYAKRAAASVELGVAFYKQDDPYPRMITSQELQKPELGPPLGTSLGMSEGESAAEYLNVANSLYAETLVGEYRKATGHRTMAIWNGYGVSVGSHRWPAAWAADYAAGTGLLNASLSGHSMACLDMRNATPAGIHLGFLTPFSIIDAWAYYNEPWLYPPHLLDCHRLYAKLRHRLEPYLASAMHEARSTGVPLLRPMLLDYQNDAAMRDLATQHMLGEWLLVGHESRVYLPQGVWIDYWSGITVASAGQWVECDLPEPAGGPIFVRAGAIIPCKPIAPYLDAEPLELVILHLYPAPGASSLTLVEDDGLSYDYESGAVATTAIGLSRDGRGVKVEIGERSGRHAGMPEGRTYLVCVHLDPGAEEAAEVRVDSRPLARQARRETFFEGSDDAGFWMDAERGRLWVKPEGGWRFGPDARGSVGGGGDPRSTPSASARDLGGDPRSTPSASARDLGGDPRSTPSASARHLGGDPRSTPSASARDLGGDPERDSIVWARAARPRGSRIEISIRTRSVLAGRLRPATAPPESPTPEPDRLHVAALPPERIALRHGEWLPLRTGFWVTLMTGSSPSRGHERAVRLEVLDGRGELLRLEERHTLRGRVRFGDLEYRPDEWLFRFSSPALPPVELRIRPAPAVPGRMG